MSSKTELLKKVKALANMGVDGERENANDLLLHLMEEYGISELELEEEHKEIAWFRYSDKMERRLLGQIIYMVTGKIYFECEGAFSGRKRKELGVECTVAERLEIELNYKFFKGVMEEDLDIFFSAFAKKNHLFPSESKVKPRSVEELTPEERERYLKSDLMSAGMERHTLRKQIGAEKD